jgi:catechol 2,3-dioxygenase-like lactoylglutathione lyase family enzyme
MKKMLLFFALAAPAVVRGQSAQAFGQPAAFNVAGAFFALSVADVEASSKWYAEKLGLKMVKQLANSTDTPAVKIMAGGGLIVELIEMPKALPLSKAAPAIRSTEMVHGIFKVGVVVDDLDQVLAVLKARDVPAFLGPFPAGADSMRNVIIKDNAGNLIQFFARK